MGLFTLSKEKGNLDKSQRGGGGGGWAASLKKFLKNHKRDCMLDETMKEISINHEGRGLYA